MKEILILVGCLYGSSDSCAATGAAYYKQSGIEQKVVEIEKQYSDNYRYVGPIITLGAAAAKKELILQLDRNSTIIIKEDKSILENKWEF